MEVEGLSTVDPNTNYEKILPIHQKRTIAFINHFITSTVSFLNTFAQSCESRLMEFEYKIQKIEASLLILESQLSSISSLDNNVTENSVNSNKDDHSKVIREEVTSNDPLDLPSVKNEEDNLNEDIKNSTLENPLTSHKVSQDPKFVKFFKMVQFGVPIAAVKHKMITEGLDPCILDNPNEVIPDTNNEVKHELGDSNGSSDS